MKTILAPTDFSAISLNAVSYAASIADAINARLYILHVYQPPMAFSEVPFPQDSITEMIRASEDRILELRDEMLEKTGSRIMIHTEVTSGALLAELNNYCDMLRPYAVVMGTQGKSAAERVFLGSNTLAAMKQVAYPLILVPPGAAFTSIKKIGLACDLKRVEQSTPLNEIKALVRDFNAKLVVVHVNRESDPVYTPEIVDASGTLQQMLEELHPSYHFLDQADVQQGLNEFSQKHQLDLLIVVPKKYNWLETIFHKSESRQMVLHTQLPVMAIHE